MPIAGRKKIEFDLAEVERLAQTMDSDKEIALALGISEDTLGRRKRDSADFADAIKKGKAKGRAFVGGKLMEKIADGDTAAMIFYLKAKAGWKEKQEITGSFTSEVPEGLLAIKKAYIEANK